MLFLQQDVIFLCIILYFCIILHVIYLSNRSNVTVPAKYTGYFYSSKSPLF